MIDIRKDVYDALCAGCPGADVSDAWPQDWARLPKVTYTEENNAVEEWTDNAEQSARIVYRIDVWDKRSTTAIAAQVDAAMASIGMLRTMSRDVPSGTDPAKHRQMRYECIADRATPYVFH